MCGNLSQFKSIKRFREPHQVRIANHTFVDVHGYGPIALETPYGQFILTNTWYIPEFNHTKLLSVTTLMSEGFEIRFLPNMTASAFRDSRLIFTEFMHNGLIY